MVKAGRGGERSGPTVPASRRTPSTLEGRTAPWRHTSEALGTSERQYRELVEYSLGLICTHDLSGTILSINPAAASSLGYEPEDGVGRNLRDFISPHKRTLFDDYLRRIREHGRDEGLMSVISKSGATRVWLYRNVLSYAADGTSCVIGHAVDVTERVAIERTLRRSEQALRAAHDRLEARVAERTAELEEANEHLRVEIANREAAERSRESALIEQRDTLAFLANFSDRLSPLVALDQLIDVVRHLVVPFLADATIVHPVSDDGSAPLVPESHRDSPASREPARSPDGTSAGPPSPIDNVIATGSTAILERQDLSSLSPRSDQREASEVESARAAALLPLVMDGRVKAVLTLLSRTEHRFAGSRALIVDDVARRIRLALDRIQLYREAQEANRLKDEFLGTLSHELRTPLNAILGWASILRTRQLDEPTAHGVAVIRRNADAQIRLIEEVLDVSRIITGKMALTMDVLDVGDVIRAAIDIVRPAMSAKKIRFEERIAGVPPIIGDGHRLQQVFWNLLSNAIKFSSTDGAITVSLRSVSGRLEFEIADTGIGIRREVLPFVFDRFRQADSSTTRTHGGLGLGLAIVRHIVELHGGTVRAASAGEGQGATFTIQLPCTDRRVAAAHESSARTHAREDSGPPMLRGRTILVVEDHDDARELVSAVLEDAGALVVAASSTAEAIERVTGLRPDVLVADLGLPGEDGFALLTRFRALHPGVPAVALTAYARSTDRDRALAHGFQHHLVKPLDPKKLVERIASVIRDDD
jgi:PAS domain S-box-containing protein